MSRRQALLWLPGKAEDELGPSRVPFASEPAPDFVWSLSQYADELAPPTLPYAPVHWRNAFLEDRGHDWNLRNGVLTSYPRCDGFGHWLLLEWETK